jgi:hypothetical protein
MPENKIVLYIYRNFDSIIISLLAFFSILIFTGRNGIGISPDSIAYLSTARNIHQHHQMLDYNLQPLIAFPVFYPMFLSVVMFISGKDIVVAAAFLNALMMALLILLSSHVIKRCQLKSAWYRRILLLLLVFSPALTEVYGMLWSETLLLLFSLLFFLCLEKYLNHKSVFYLLLCAGIAGLATTTRYAGITLTGTAGLLILFAPGFNIRKKLGHLFLFSMVSFAFLVLNLLRNHVLGKSLTGPRQFGQTPVMDNISYYGKVLCNWFPVFNEQYTTGVITGLSVFVFLTFMFFYRCVRRQQYSSQQNITAAFVVVYSIFIIGISTLSHFEGINNRLMVPVFIPVLLAVSYWIPFWLSGLKPLARKTGIVMLTLFLLLLQYKIIVHLEEMYRDAVDNGIPGYTDNSWKNSSTANFLAAHPGFLNSGYKIYSNAHEAVYFNAGGLRADEIPQRVYKDYTEEFYKEGIHYVIWFNQIDDPELISLPDILKHRKLLQTYKFRDGRIFLLCNPKA